VDSSSLSPVSCPVSPVFCAPSPPEPAYDRAAALERLGWDEELFAEVADLFRTDAPRMMEEIRQAIAAGDAVGVRRSAHGLKGSAGYVGGGPTVTAALALEEMAAAGDLTTAPMAADSLEREIDRLTTALAASPR
jgi:two-component system, sensor histidine kinase and response regulator